MNSKSKKSGEQGYMARFDEIQKEFRVTMQKNKKLEQ